MGTITFLWLFVVIMTTGGVSEEHHFAFKTQESCKVGTPRVSQMTAEIATQHGVEHLDYRPCEEVMVHYNLPEDGGSQ